MAETSVNDLLPTKAPGSPVAVGDLHVAFASFLRLDVANGDASQDTITGYWSQVRAWVDWCRTTGREPATATSEDVKAYRQELVSDGYKASSIKNKLNVVARFYQAAIAAGLRTDNPAAGIRAPRAKQAIDDFRYLTEGELLLLLREVPAGDEEKALRDRAMVGLMALHGLRTIEIQRANIGDVERRGDSTVLLCRGKGHDRLIFLRPDVSEALTAYLRVRGSSRGDRAGQAMFTAVGNFAGGHRLSRRGLRRIVDGYLEAAKLKREGLSNHALRHTAATLAYQYTRDLRAVQDMLGHSDPKTTSRYARIVDRAKNNPAAAVPVKL